MALPRALLPLGLLLALALPAHAAASAHATVVVKESGCPSGETYCFAFAQGSMADLAPGAQVTLAFHNIGKTVHELLVTGAGAADASHHATPEDGKLAAIEDVPAGGWGNATFTVPAGGVYLWCGQPGHESLGMWMAPASTAATSKGAPAVGAGLVLLGLVAAAARRLR